MGDIKGFLKVDRKVPSQESPQERVQHYKEFYTEVDENFKKDQASRCMDCGIPFCHNGCPLGNLIPDFNDAVYQEKWKDAYDILNSTNNFPEFTGRICPAPCEASCVLNIEQSPVAIEFIEKSIIEKAYTEGWVIPSIPKTRTGKKIAVVGSGPAGLACADQLNKLGYNVIVFERDDRAGGLLRYGIPDFKLGKNIIDRRLDIMKESGIEFRLNINVGEDISVDQLQKEYDAIVICTGSTVPRDLSIPGRNLKGVDFAMDFLSQSNRRVAGDSILDQTIIDAKDKNIVVIGGGDTGSDCIGTSNRQRAKSITQFEIMNKPPSGINPETPWPNWPMILRTSSSHQEGCERSWSILTKEFLSDDGINISGVQIVEVEWAKDDKGAYTMREIESTKRIIPCEQVFLAIGFLHTEKKGLLTELGIQLDQRGNIIADNYRTNLDNVFAAGDARRGQSLVVWAISEGRLVAKAVDEYITDRSSILDHNEKSILAL